LVDNDANKKKEPIVMVNHQGQEQKEETDKPEVGAWIREIMVGPFSLIVALSLK